MNSVPFALVASYLLGAIPFGFLVVKLFAGADVRESGSGSTGATNVTRKAGLKAGAITYLLDVLKGAAAVFLMRQVSDSWWLYGAAATLAILGHMYPIFLRFKGGKGVATGVGAYIALVPLPVLSTLVVWILIFRKYRMVSLASIVATALVPIVWVPLWWLLLKTPAELLPACISIGVGCALVIAKHHENIGRLLAGTESKFERRSAA